jgi:hypothetical protein
MEHANIAGTHHRTRIRPVASYKKQLLRLRTARGWCISAPDDGAAGERAIAV